MGDVRGPGEPAGEWYEVHTRFTGHWLSAGPGPWTTYASRIGTAEDARKAAANFVDGLSRDWSARVVRVRGEVVEEFGGGEGG